MSKTKPSNLKGTRDVGPDEMIKRNFIFDSIKHVFKKFGFLQIETPSMEKLEVLTGKYGDEGDQLIFKILNSGDYLSNLPKEIYNQGSKAATSHLCKKALRYDLTVPFARFVAMNHSTLAMPFKRFQIQPVWRADRPQKGRYQEFFQCDADVVGTTSLVCEAEIVLMIKEVFETLQITDYTIKINNRKVLAGLAQVIKCENQETDLYVAIDKLDKMPFEKISQELTQKGFEAAQISTIKQFIEAPTLSDTLALLESSQTGQQGIQEIKEVQEILKGFGVEVAQLQFDSQLARGLSYYTGCIFEVKVNNVSIGSVSGGGRYDDLTGVFGLEQMPGVGFSFGVDRIYDVMEELGIFPSSESETTQVLLTNFDAECFHKSLPLLTQLRAKGIKSEIYPESAKMKKQFNYADKKNIPYVLIAGSEEFEQGKFNLKNMKSGEQVWVSITQIIEKLA